MNRKVQKKTFKSRECGLSMLEYALGAVALIALVSVAVNAFGGSLANYFNALANWVDDQTNEVEP